MQQRLTITVPEEIRLALDDETQREGISLSDLLEKPSGSISFSAISGCCVSG